MNKLLGETRQRHFKTMHRSNRSGPRIGLIASILASVLISVLIIGWGLSKTAEYQRQSDFHTKEYSAYISENMGNFCVNMAAPERADCVARIRNERRAFEREEQDLVAQKQSALWAYIMGAAAVAGMGLSVIGVYLVWATFEATREANRIAREETARAEREAATARRALINSERAIIRITHVTADLPPLDTRNAAMVTFHMINHGKSNATNFQIFYFVSDEPVFRSAQKIALNRTGICTPNGSLSLDPIQIRKRSTYPAFLIGYISYTTLHDTHFNTFFCRRLTGIPHRDSLNALVHDHLEEFPCQRLPASN